MHDAPRAEVGEDEGEQRPEEQIVNMHEVAGPAVLGMVPQEGCPGLATRTLRTSVTHVPLDGALGDLDVQLQQLPLNAVCTPEPVVDGHRLDQCDGLRWKLGFMRCRERFPLPEQPETLSMPTKNRLWLDDEQCV